jgi:hypothetical protein
MPSAKRLAFLRESVRNHPVIVATSAATCGVLLGVFVAVQLLATPKPRSDSAGTAQAAIVAKAKPVAETTGSAPTGEGVASAGCEQQTWPHLSRTCIEDYRNKTRVPRVVSTDKLDKPDMADMAAVGASPPASANELKLAAPAPWASSVASPAPPAIAPSVKTVNVPVKPPEPPAPAAAPEPPVAASTDAQTTSQAAVKDEAKEKREAKDKRFAKKAKHKPKAPVKQDVDDHDSAVASDDSDDRAADDRTDRRPGRSRRIVERWIERDYEVPDYRGGGQRRVTVIRRSGGGMFESLFGN